MYRITGNLPWTPCGRTMRTRTSPTSAATVVQRSSTGSLSIGSAWTSSRTLRASSGVSWYRNGGVAVASTNACEAGSSTTGASVVSIDMSVSFGSDGDAELDRVEDRVHRRGGIRDRDGV